MLESRSRSWLGVWIFCEWHHKWSSLPFWPMLLPGLRPNH